MNETIVTLIAIGSLMACMLLIGGVTSLVYYIVDRREKSKWYEALAKDSHLRELLDTETHLWEVYSKKSDIASAYKRQIDILLSNITYLPSYERDWREAQAEIYKQQYFEAKTDAEKWYDTYVIAHNNLEEYCTEHKLKRVS